MRASGRKAIGMIPDEAAYRRYLCGDQKAAEVLARETGIAIYTLDSLTSGELSAEAYETGILADARTRKEALEDADA